MLAAVAALSGCPTTTVQVQGSGPVPAATSSKNDAAGKEDAIETGPVLMRVRGAMMTKDKQTTGALQINQELHSGDYVSFYVLLDRNAYVYVVQFFADGTQEVLFPAKEGETVLVKADEEMRLPAASADWYKLDSATGVENLYIIASVKPFGPDNPVSKLVHQIRTSPADSPAPPPPATARAAPTAVASAAAPDGAAKTLVDQPAAPQPPAKALPKPPPRQIYAMAQPKLPPFMRTRGVQLERVETGTYQGKTGEDGVGVFHFPFVHK